jgi:four helix bundle protein
MARISRFEDLEVWRDARKLVGCVYETTGKGILSKDFGLKDQLQRAAVSIMSNIAEGFERGNRKEFIWFLNIAKASAAEVRSLAYVAYDIKYINDGTFQVMNDSVSSLSRQISGFIKYLKKIKD